MRRIAIEENPRLRHELLDMMVYIEFLMYESGREAIDSLIEFEPNREESIINVLYSELVTYNYLMSKCSKQKENPRWPRLLLREEFYKQEVKRTYRTTIKNKNIDSWKKAAASVGILEKPYKDRFGESLTPQQPKGAA
jgi:hypothetical protein